MNESKTVTAKNNNHLDGRRSQEITVRQYSAPIPPPDMLEQYEKILPGAAERIMSSFEFQSRHRQSCEKIFVLTLTTKTILGLFFGFIIAMTTIIGGIIAALRGLTFLGGSLSFVGLAILAGAFISEKNKKEEEKEEEKE